MTAKKKFPGIQDMATELVYRSMGTVNFGERIGCGFMDKNGVTNDNINLDFPCYVLVYILNGNGTYVDSHGTRYPLSAGMLFQRFPGHIHSNFIEPDSGWKECYLDLGQSMYKALMTMGLIRPQYVLKNIGLDMNLIIRMWDFKEDLKSCEDDKLPDCLVEFLSILNMFFYRVKPDQRAAKNNVVESFARSVSENLEEGFDVREFCLQQGIGYEKFRKQFKAQTGISPNQYRIRKRLDTGCKLLSNPENSIAEIADTLGYSSPYEFSAQFKKHYGISPNHYRQGLG